MCLSRQTGRQYLAIWLISSTLSLQITLLYCTRDATVESLCELNEKLTITLQCPHQQNAMQYRKSFGDWRLSCAIFHIAESPYFLPYNQKAHSMSAVAFFENSFNALVVKFIVNGRKVLAFTECVESKKLIQCQQLKQHLSASSSHFEFRMKKP